MNTGKGHDILYISMNAGVVNAVEKQFIRIENITIENFKNVKKGTISLKNRRKNYRASILGLYGQNGSGKTALIDAVQLLRFALCSQPIPEKYAEYINVEERTSTLKFQFVYSILYKPCIFKAYRLLNVQTLCIFPCFCPYEPKQGKFFILRRLPYPAVLRKYASLPL